MRESDANLKRFSDLDDVEVAKDDPDVRGWDVVTPDGRDIGEVKDLLVDTSEMKVHGLEVELEGSTFSWDDNRRVAIPVDAVQIDEDRDNVVVNGLSVQELSTLPPYGARTARDVRAGAAGRERLTRSEEELTVGKRDVETGEVRVGKHVETEHVSQDVNRTRERVRVERRPITEATRGSADMGNDEIRVPIHEEELVVEKRPVAKEELVISKEQVSEPQRVEADVKKERFEVDKSRDVLEDTERKNRGEY